MPLKIDPDLLIDAGYGALSGAQATTLLREFYDALETIVGLQLADQMSPRQLDAFEEFFNAGDNEGAFRWLERNFPDYKTVTSDAYSELKAALAVASEKLRQDQR